MSSDEIDKIQKYEFNTLWDNLWMYNKFKPKKKNFINDNILAKKKFEKIREGYYVDNIFISINYFINNLQCRWFETEWGIPKGRRNIKETDYDAAKREFMEETGILDDNFIILSNVPPFIEEYLGTDNITYKHIYYLAKSIGNISYKIDLNSKFQITEISKIGMFDTKECLNLIRDYYVEKKKIILNAEKYIFKKKLFEMNNIFLFNNNNKKKSHSI